MKAVSAITTLPLLRFRSTRATEQPKPGADRAHRPAKRSDRDMEWWETGGADPHMAATAMFRMFGR
jgi:hypothetical protein